jgi:nicotinate-nucleotide adenylyltransferase
MTEEQQSLYETEKSKVRNLIIENFKTGGVKNSAVLVLRALTMLRQLANHPRMLDTGSEAGSGKFKDVTDSLVTVLAENHKVLIFSSFVKHLTLVDEYCNEKGFRYALLTGSTTNRENVINSFKQKSEIQLFLISLKAGGVGLNLTEADYVFILDPWWNPAAEMQALNRAKLFLLAITNWNGKTEMRIGVFGGTFDPPHMGHLILAEEARFKLEIDLLLWVLTPTPPHKMNKPISPVEQRLKLVKTTIKKNPNFTLSTIELDRPGPHYVIDTIRLLREKFDQDEIYYLMGGDSLRNLPNWNEPIDFIWTVDGLGVMRRPGDLINLEELEEKIPGISERITFIDAPLLEISSSQIRERISTGRPFQYYLLPDVYQLILKNQYYQD